MRQAKPTRGAMLFVSVLSSAFGNAPVYGPVSPEMTGAAAVKSGVDVEVDHLSDRS